MKKFTRFKIYFNKKSLKVITLAIILKLAGEKKLQNKIPITQFNFCEPEITRIVPDSNIEPVIMLPRGGSDNMIDDNIIDDNIKNEETKDSQKPKKFDDLLDEFDEFRNTSDNFNKPEATAFEYCIRTKKTTIKTKKSEVYHSVGTIKIGRKNETSEEVTTIRTQIDNTNRMDVDNQIVKIVDDNNLS